MLPFGTRFAPSRVYSVDERGDHVVSLPQDRTTDPRKDVPIPMTSGTMHNDGHMAGAARPGTCAVRLGYAGTHASIPTRKWLAVQTASPVFATDRPIPRPLERSP
jgi:hypothetical protein